MATFATNTPVLTSPASIAATSALNFFITAIAMHKQRKSLRKLNARQLNDIGLTRQEALAEATRSFWDVK